MKFNIISSSTVVNGDYKVNFIAYANQFVGTEQMIREAVAYDVFGAMYALDEAQMERVDGGFKFTGALHPDYVEECRELIAVING